MSFEKNGSFTLINYINLFTPSHGLILKINIIDVLLESLSISVPAGVFTVILCLIVTIGIKGKKYNMLEVYMLLPIGISIVSLSYGVSYIFGGYLSNRLTIIVIHSVLAFPISLRLLKYSIDKTPDSIIFIARSLGASRTYAFLTIELPMYSRGIANALSYAIAISLSEITAVLVIGRGSIETIPMAIYKFINNYQFGQALSLSCLYILLLFIMFSIIDRQVLRRD
jgi:ABC-type Fe3+ transport system permease subunit